jgi:hypothetical protein
MKTTTASALCATVLLATCCLFTPGRAHAWDIESACFPNTLTQAGLPYQNLDCFYSWTVNSNTFASQGSWTADLSTRTSPDHIWIACASQTGSLRANMKGYLYQATTPTPGSPPHWAVIKTSLATEFAYIYTPLVLCP